MKKLLLVLLCLPMIGFGQELITFKKSDIILNQVLENTVSFIKNKNKPKIRFRFYYTNGKSSINWNAGRFYKWQLNDGNAIKLK